MPALNVSELVATVGVPVCVASEPPVAWFLSPLASVPPKKCQACRPEATGGIKPIELALKSAF
jgi:hypothetical protein